MGPLPLPVVTHLCETLKGLGGMSGAQRAASSTDDLEKPMLSGKGSDRAPDTASI